jgi:hypothetical protein
MSEQWRGVLAALVNPELRAALAEVTATPLTENRRARAFARLEQIGLVTAGPDGTWVFTDEVVRSILSEGAKPRPTGVYRFLDADGRIDRYPVGETDRRDLLAWVASQALEVSEVLTEDEVNDRLEPYAPGGDVAVLRRYLVDHELLERTRSGSEYARVAESGG